MNIADVTRGERSFTISWDDQSVAEFPFIWLRDNDPDELHPDTRERVFDLTSVDLEIRPDTFSLESDALVVNWPQKNVPSVYSLDWLQLHRPGGARFDPAIVARTLWDRESLTQIPRFEMTQCFEQPVVLRNALLTLKRFGILIIDGLSDSADASRDFGDLVGFRRRTNFGDTFEVISKPAPNNLAYTSLALPLHTDLPNQEIIPGYQLLHCYRNTCTGGESVFADGFRICADLKKDAAADFELLSQVQVPWRFHDQNHDIRRRRPIICQREDGQMDYFVFNAHIADVPDMHVELMYDYYAAYQSLMRRIRDPQYAIRHALVPGEMVVFDNSRVLHGRMAFDAESGERHLRGYYIERNELDDRIRVLDREETACPWK
jgi:gamma-butyrobetaine dioxygenase